eukprot:7035780-Pyramimonas_sp.AAC.1
MTKSDCGDVSVDLGHRQLVDHPRGSVVASMDHDHDWRKAGGKAKAECVHIRRMTPPEGTAGSAPAFPATVMHPRDRIIYCAGSLRTT